MAIQFGCVTRPWNDYTWEDFLAGTAGAGYDCIGTTRFGKEWIVAAEVPLEAIKRRRAEVEEAGLTPSTCWADFPFDGGPEKAEEGLRAAIDAVAAFGAPYLLSCGAARGPHEDLFYDTMAACCDYAEDQGVMLTLKPHGGITCSGADLAYALERIDHDNFGIFYDPGNIVHYKGLDPVNELLVVADWVVGMCIKDSLGEREGVNILPGTGVVDFEGVFELLLYAGFDGPLLVECLGGETLDEVNENAAKTREFLGRLTGEG